LSKRPLPDDLSDAANRLIAAARSDDTAYRRLAYLCDRIGNRLAGSKALNEAIRWAVDEMKRDGFDSVRAEKVMVPHWERGTESAEVVEPVKRTLSMLGLGMSVGTKRGGVTAEVVVVQDYAELDRLGETGVRGKIVCYNVPYTSYGATVAYRSGGASRAAKLGAVAMLIRSVGPTSLRTPHTGSLRYTDDAPKIPAAAITIEDAEMLARMQGRGEKPTVRLVMGAKMHQDAESANVVADLRGREFPDEIVLICGHLDSWDVGQGAHDDGGGCLVAWEAARLMKTLGLRPRRTVRVVLYTNEENGLRGGTTYRDTHRADLPNHILAIEADSGVWKPFGFGVGGSEKTLAAVKEYALLLTPIGADRIRQGGGGADIGPLAQEGVPVMGLDTDTAPYFNIHHTPADTFDKIDPKLFADCVAAMAVMAYAVAERPARLER
jgi:carboxypeptidase Q